MRNLLLFLCLSLCSTIAMGQLRGGLLPIDQAYKVSAEIKAPGVVAVHFVIAPHYYLYRGQMKFTGGEGTTLGQAELPQGEKRHDEFLGDVEVYHKSIDVTLPYTLAPGVHRIKLNVRYQGCHEVEPKICYPPHTQTFELPAPAAVAAGVHAPPASSTNSTTLTRVPDSSVEASTASTAAPAYGGTPAARAALAAGDAAVKKNDMAEAVANYKKAITLDPDFVEAQLQYTLYQQTLMPHRKLTNAQEQELGKKARKSLIHEYEGLAARHPDKAVYPYVLAQSYMETDIPRAEHYCRQAVQIDPRFAQGYACLAALAYVASDNKKAVALQRKAVQLDPTNVELAATYLTIIEDDPDAFQAEAKQLVRRFPHSNAIFYNLYTDASQREPDSARIAALEQLRRDLPAEASETSELIDKDLFSYYLATDLNKALAIAQEGLKGAAKDQSSKKRWKKNVAYVDALLKAQSQIRAGQPGAALKALEGVQDQKDEEIAKTWYLLRARALAATGRTEEAIKLLRDDFAAQPTDVVLHALINYGAKLGKTKSDIYNEVWAAMKAKAKPAPNFTLKRFDNDKPVSLSDYKGKVVIVDFWYPECAPCREAFPYLQKIATKFKDKGVTVLAINSVKEQEQLVQPFLRSRGYGFLALKGNMKFAQSVYGVWGFPSTFVIGADGNIYFRPFTYDDARERSAETGIEFLLTRAKP